MTDHRWALMRLSRYAVAASGPLSVAIVHFLLSLVMLRTLTATDFGIFTILLIVAQLCWGVWSALFCAPLPVLLLQGSRDDQQLGISLLLTMNWIAAALSAPLFLLLASALSLPVWPAVIFALYGALSLLRWFGRAYSYVRQQQARSVASDIAYSVAVPVAFIAGTLLLQWPAGTACYAALLAGALAGLLPLGRPFFALHIGTGVISAFRSYRRIWRQQSRWALLGVVTTEATANAHVYIVTWLQGPSAFAPLAASALLMRPVNVAQNALTDFERPQLARLIAGRHINEIDRSLMAFRLTLIGIGLATLLAAIILFATSPHLVFPPIYDLTELKIATGLWAAVAALRLLQTPESALLQAAGAFRPLAMASVWSAIGSVAAVLLLVVFAGALWSIAGLIAGAAIYLAATCFAAWQWRNGLTDADQNDAPIARDASAASEARS